MGAHLRKLPTIYCNTERCERKAEVSLFNTFNEKMGDYCRRHGDERLTALKASEALAVGWKSEKDWSSDGPPLEIL